MKTTSKFLKVISLLICVAMLTLAFASCSASKNVAISYTAEDGVTYTLSEAEYKVLMTIVKQNLFSQYYYYGYYYGPEDSADFWASKTSDGETYEQLYTNNVLEIAKSTVIEQYLAASKGLADAEGNLKFGDNTDLKKEYDAAVSAIAENVKSLGGKGSYKRYYGYMPADLENYYKMTYRSKLVMDKIYEETPLTDEQLDEYYKENFKQYILILINKEEDIKYEKDKDGEYVLDDNGNKKPYYVVYDKTGSTKYVTDISEKYLKDNEYTLAYSYQYEKITDEARKTAKKDLAGHIFALLKDGKSFEDLAAEYSDEMLTHYYKPGYMVDGDLISDDNAREAIKDLEVGEYTTEVIQVDSKYEYIVKRVELTEKAYTHADEDAEDKTYADLFGTYRDVVESKEYSDMLEEMAKNAAVNTAVTKKYTMKDTFLSKMFGQ